MGNNGFPTSLNSIALLVILSSIFSLDYGCAPSLPRPKAGTVNQAEKSEQIRAVSYQVASDTLSYLLGPGDVLSIYVHDEPDISRDNIAVRFDGYITYFLVGDIFVTGKSLLELDYLITESLQKFIYEPDVTVFLSQSNSKKYVILGGIEQQGVYPLTSATRLTDAIHTAGGLMRSRQRGGGARTNNRPDEILADLSAAYIVRGNQRLAVDLESIYFQGNASQDIYLQPDDYVYVPLKSIQNIYVLGEVETQSVISSGRSITLIEALAAAGGVLSSAKKSDIRVLRGNGTFSESMTIDYNDIVAGDIHDLQLNGGDIVHVPRSELSLATQWIQQFIETVQSIQLTRFLIEDLENQ